jgi:hypothetical protein
LLVQWRNKKQPIVQPIFAQTESRNSIGSNPELVINPTGTERSKQVLTNQLSQIGANVGQMIAAQNTIEFFSNIRRNSDIVPGLRVLRHEHISMMQLESGDLAPRSSRRHEFEALFDEVVVIHVHVVAEAYGLLAVNDVFVHAAEPD